MENKFEFFTDNIRSMLRTSENFDIVERKLIIAESDASMFFVDGLIKDDIMEKVMEFLLADGAACKSAEEFSNRFIPYVETDLKENLSEITTAVLSGSIALCLFGYDRVIIIDARTYPVRGVEEPDNERTLRGARDGFVETIIFNTAQIRRRIRDINFTVEYAAVGEVSKTDVAICYMKGKVDSKLLAGIKQKLAAIRVECLSMSMEGLAESLIKKRWYNPFPKIRYTERPDVASAVINEGSIVLLCDNSPEAMILPTSIFDFIKDADDYYFPPLTGTYMRILRFIIVGLTVFLVPAWYYLIKNPDILPQWLKFIEVKKHNDIPIILQLLIIEFAVDGLKLASLNTPNTLTSSLSVVAGLILGELAVQVGWFVPEVLLYMAFVTIANFSQTSLELGYALKFMRMLLLALIALFNLIGLIVGVVLIFLLVATNKTVGGKRNYLYPFLPFSASGIKDLFLRIKV